MRRSLTSLSIIALLGGLIGRGLRYTVNVVIARGLGAEALGLFAFGMVVMKAGGVVARLGLGNAVQKFIPVYRNQDRQENVTGTVILGLTFPLIFGPLIGVSLHFVIFPFLTKYGMEISQSTVLFLFGIPFFGTLMVGTAATRSYKETKYSVITRDIGQSSIALITAFFGAYLVGSFTYVIVGYVFSLVIGTLLSVFFLIKLGAIRRRPLPVFDISEIFGFAIPLAIVAVANYVLTWTDVLMLEFLVSSTELGWYQAAYQTSLMLTILLQSANSVFPSVAADLHHKGGTKKLEGIFTTLTKWVISLSSLGFVFVTLYSEILMGVFGVFSKEAELTLIVLCAGQLVTVSTGPVGKLLAMSGYDRVESLNTVVVLVLNIGLNFVLIQKYGILGAGIATAISLSFLNVLRVAESWFFLDILPFSTSHLKTAVPLGVAIGSLLILTRLTEASFINMVFVGVVTLTAFFMTKLATGFDEEDELLLESLK